MKKFLVGILSSIALLTLPALAAQPEIFQVYGQSFGQWSLKGYTIPATQEAACVAETHFDGGLIVSLSQTHSEKTNDDYTFFDVENPTVDYSTRQEENYLIDVLFVSDNRDDVRATLNFKITNAHVLTVENVDEHFAEMFTKSKLMVIAPDTPGELVIGLDGTAELAKSFDDCMTISLSGGVSQ
jgi:hypothetical protein